MSAHNSQRPSCLFLCQNLPYPPDGGALIRSYHTIQILSSEFDLTILAFYRRSSRPSPESVQLGKKGLERFGDVHVFPIPQEFSRIRLIRDHALSVLSRTAYTMWTYHSSDFAGEIERLSAEKEWDLVHLDSIDLIGYRDRLPPAPLVVSHHNVESDLLARRSEAERGLRRRYLRHQARLVREMESKWCPRVALNLMVSQEDETALRNIAPASKTMLFPNGVDTEYFSAGAAERVEGIVFVGGSTWFPNLDGMTWFADEVLPHVRVHMPDVRVRWVGRTDPESKARFEGLGIEVIGYVPDVRPYLREAAVFVVPIRVGGGSRLKVLDAWAAGKAIVTTGAGAEGLPCVDGENVLLSDDPQRFAARILQVLHDPSLRKALGAHGRATAERYSWSRLGLNLLTRYRELVGLEPPPDQNTVLG